VATQSGSAVTSAFRPGGARTLRLTRRGRIVVSALAALGIVGSVLVAGTAVATDPEPPIEVATVTIAPGETLWHHAQDVPTTGQDLRDVVDTIMEINGLSTSQLQAGQQLLIPTALE